jgi:hypothetical protein
MNEVLNIMDELEKNADLVFTGGTEWSRIRDAAEKLQTPKRGRSKGDVSENSLTAKLLTLRPGETMYLPDVVCPNGKQSVLRSALTTYPKRIPSLKGRVFSGTAAVVTDVNLECARVMAIRRVSDENAQ